MENYYQLLNVGRYASEREIALACKDYISNNPNEKEKIENIFLTLVDEQKRFQYNGELFKNDDTDIKTGFEKDKTNEEVFSYYEVDKTSGYDNVNSIKFSANDDNFLFSIKFFILFIISFVYIIIYVRYEIVGWGRLTEYLKASETAKFAKNVPFYDYLMFFGSLFIFLFALFGVYYFFKNSKTYFSKKEYHKGQFIGYLYEVKFVTEYQGMGQTSSKKTYSKLFFRFDRCIYSSKLSYDLFCKMMKNNIQEVDIVTKKKSARISRKFLKKLRYEK